MDIERKRRFLQMMILEAGATDDEWEQFDAIVQGVSDRYPKLLPDQ